MTAARLGVFGHGMVTAVGNDATSTCAAMRAKVRGAAKVNLWDHTAGAHLQAARPARRQWWEGPTMWPELAAPAVAECAALARAGATGERLDPHTIPVISLLPPMDRPMAPKGDLNGFGTALGAKLGWTLAEGSGTLRVGRTGAAHALAWVHRAIGGSNAKAVIVVGVESFLRQSIVRHYIDAGRLLCGINSNGFIPGEAACAVLVAPVNGAVVNCLEILGVGLARESAPGVGGARRATRAEALSGAWRDALASAGLNFFDIAFTVSDLNGERFKFKEAAFAAARLDRVPPEGRSRRSKGLVELWHPSEFLGEIGSAISPCMLGWAYEAGKRGYAPSPHTLIHASEDDGERMAMVTRYVSAA